MELFSPGHLIVLAIVVAVLFFGWKQLPDMSRSLGRSLRIFKTEIKGMSEDDKARKAREEADEEQKALPAADIVKRETAGTDAPVSRPRPSPSPHSRG
jgi:sec-independent protein translocase protein TatA